MKILLALTDAMVAHPLQATLEFQGQVVETDRTGADVLQLIDGCGFDALVVDPDLPAPGGVELIRAVRMRSHRIPIVVLSRFGALRHKLLCFEAGADDYMTLPFEGQELYARLKVIARRAAGFTQGVARFGDVSIDFTYRTVRARGDMLHFTPCEYGTLEALALRAGRVLSREQLYDFSHSSDASGCMKVVDVLVHKIRAKFRRLGLGDVILNVRGKGYYLPKPDPVAPCETEAA